MCFREEIDAPMRRHAREEALARAAKMGKCDALLVVDKCAIRATPGKTIGDVLKEALPVVSELNPAAADTVRRLLKLEGL